jgi:hypothetical protein
MILDDESDEADAEDEAEDAFSDADAGRIEQDASPHNTLATSKLGLGSATSIGAPCLEKWFDVEEGRYVYEPVPRLESCEQQDASSAPMHDQRHTLRQSSEPPQDQIDQQDTGDMIQSTSVESAPHSRPGPSNTGDDGWTDDSMAELEGELGLALVEQVNSSSASAPGSPCPPRSVEASQDESQSRKRSEATGSRPEDLRDASRYGTSDQGLECEQRENRVVVKIAGGREQQEEELVELVGEVGGGEMQQDEEPAMEEQQEEEEEDDFDNPKDEDYHHDTSDDDEDPRPKKRQKCLGRHRLMPPAATQVEIDATQTQADQPTSTDDKHHHSSRTSRSPSATTESVLVAEYQEWPFQGFLKRTKIGDDITYNLEFKLPSIWEHLYLPINSEALDICPSRKALAKSPVPHEASVYSKIRQAPLQPQKKRVRWTPEEDATLLQMRSDGCSWEDIHAALPHRSMGTIQVRHSIESKKLIRRP